MSNCEPIIKRALGAAWYELHPIIRRQHNLMPCTKTEVVMNGVMYEVFHSRIAKLFVLPGRWLFGALVQYRGTDVPTQVRNWTVVENESIYWHRVFHFHEKQPVVFASRMAYLEGDEVIEYVRFGLGMRMRLAVDNGCLIYESTGYQWDLGVLSLRFPTWLILGRSAIRQTGLSDTEFEMDFRMQHPLFGKTFGYAGRFKLSGPLQAE
ncbi:MAG: DUF4166 domain-containing protein [Thiohalobacteraceae bacterium]